MLELIDELELIRHGQQAAVLCIVLSTSGSTPRKAGSKMLVFPDRTIKGTIGGGSIERQAIEEAVKILNSGRGVTTHRFNLLDDLEMQCGGSMEVYFEPLRVFPQLYIFGGGHVGKALAGYAAGLGFRPCVIDPRQDIFSNWSIPGCETRNGDYFSIADTLVFDSGTYIVIVTPQHESDEQLLYYCAKKEFAYLGMIGSRRKVAEISKRAVETGQIPHELLSKIDMPVGIPFAAETPAEIAISIVAKMIDVKNTRNKS